MKTLKENNTHKAVILNGKIAIFEKGLPLDTFEGDEDSEYFKSKYPNWFKDNLLYTIPLENQDDLFAIFEDFDETNRCNVAEFISEIN